MKQLLVVGGGGYIGSHMVLMLAEAGHQVVTLDNFSAGYRDAVLAGEVVEGDLGDRALLDRLFAHYRFDGVFHFASHIQVGESVIDPAKYYQNNLVNTLTLLDAMVAHQVNHFIFSSTAAVFGEPQQIPIDEDHPRQPINPYGRSKEMIEAILADYDHAYGLRSVSLRYFNAAGADPAARLGERHQPETHLVPLILQVVAGRREAITVYGRDYPTADGTCIRDYIHVVDLCSAHLLAIAALWAGMGSRAFNLGNGNGYSVQQVIESVERVTGGRVKVIDGSRRAGDPAQLVADATRARHELGWQPRYGDLDTIVSHAWQWEQSLLACRS
jgi:UDP-glucose 4-epimerase